MPANDLRVLPCGDAAILVDLDDLERVLALHATLTQEPPAGVVDLVPAASTLLVVFDPASTTRARLTDDIVRRPPHTAAARPRPLVEIGVRYDGADLDDVAAHTGLTRAEVVRRHTAPEYTVAFNGFAPGFAYLTGMDPALTVPRRTSPRTRVPAGSVAVADRYSGIYPRQAPGGWQLVGHTDIVLWDLDRTPPALLLPGTRVRFLDLTEGGPE
ncbi:5-oxoprolinase subunit B family protein [Jiangella mangrovi]|uniref:KipI family sensor histidine kinase inhibitor n=1 Tax=Jiangella mangrovi TaxID=1524084 RepID=A0A7W9LMK2_9ACTN|nr:allophanate hydrolase subunit 1 [Jiangella mangrovi]MBB5789326.1 KipI family sensor histidine kinase inhibitor [Jiangella mangrovi]